MPAANSPWDRDGFLQNADKNRFKDVYCFDQTRPELIGEQKYIHANEFRLPGDCLRYVLTQQPLKNTVADFWQMIWQLKPLVIAALGQPMRDEERNLPTIGEYAKYGVFQVSRDEEIVSNKSWTTTKITLARTNTVDQNDTRVRDWIELRYVMWYEWQSDADPPPPDRMLAFVEELHEQYESVGKDFHRSEVATTDFAIVCPTGAVRAGLVAAASSLSRIVWDETFARDHIVRLVRRLKESRHGTIDRHSQLAYLYWLALEMVRETPDLTLPVKAKANVDAAVEKARIVYAATNRQEKLAAIG